MLANYTKYRSHTISWLPAGALIRRCTEVNNTTCAYRLFALVSYYRRAMSFNLFAILRELDTLQSAWATGLNATFFTFTHSGSSLVDVIYWCFTGLFLTKSPVPPVGICPAIPSKTGHANQDMPFILYHYIWLLVMGNVLLYFGSKEIDRCQRRHIIQVNGLSTEEVKSIW